MKYVSVAEMQAIEREANEAGLTYETMMNNAGHGLAALIMEEYEDLAEEGALGLVGPGNNGGDTLVALAVLSGHGWKTTAVLIKSRPLDDPLIARLINVGGKVVDFSQNMDNQSLANLFQIHAVLLDGILGTGTTLPLRKDLAQKMLTIQMIVEELDAAPFVIAVDCPSGIDCDTGEVAQGCIPADRTVTMAAVKQGLMKFPACNYVGDLDLVDIGLPERGESLQAWRDISTNIPDPSWVRDHLPRRPLEAHKGTFGTAMVIAGSSNYSGAALLAGEAAYRIGAGLVTMAIPDNLHQALAGHFLEATWLLLPGAQGRISADAALVVQQNLDRVTAILLGCGFGLADTTADFISQLLGPPALPAMVVDADGLKLLSRNIDWAARLPSRTVLTPHPGEMAILTGLTVEEIQSDRLGTAKKFSRQWGHVVVLKGAFTVIASPEGQQAIIPVASPALARAGTGDVLAGVIVGLLAQGVPPFQSAVLGAWIHAYAGLKAAEVLGGTASVLAGDVLKAVPLVLAEVLEK